MKKIYKVKLIHPFNGKHEMFFSSKQAICKTLPYAYIGIKYRTLCNLGSFENNPFKNDFCTITVHELIRSIQK